MFHFFSHTWESQHSHQLFIFADDVRKYISSIVYVLQCKDIDERTVTNALVCDTEVKSIVKIRNCVIIIVFPENFFHIVVKYMEISTCLVVISYQEWLNFLVVCVFDKNLLNLKPKLPWDLFSVFTQLNLMNPKIVHVHLIS